MTATSVFARTLTSTTAVLTYRDTFNCDPMNNSIVTNAVYTLATAYEFYRIRDLWVEFVPSAGANYVGSGSWAFINNPELMQQAYGNTNTAFDDIVANEQNSEFFPLNQRTIKRWQPGRVQSRKWYQINRTFGTGTAEFDRTVQTMLASRVEASGSSTTFAGGKFVFHVTYEFSGLGNVGTYTFAKDPTEQDPKDPQISCGHADGPTCDVVECEHLNRGEEVADKEALEKQYDEAYKVYFTDDGDPVADSLYEARRFVVNLFPDTVWPDSVILMDRSGEQRYVKAPADPKPTRSV